jgi:hypothetical protein
VLVAKIQTRFRQIKKPFTFRAVEWSRLTTSVDILRSARSLKCGPCSNIPRSINNREVDVAGQQNNTVQAVVGIIVMVGFIWYFWGGGWQTQTAKYLDQVYNQVADDAVKKYEIAKRNGRPLDVCYQARMVALAYLQAKDETNYAIWKQTESRECSSAGLPR